MASWRRPETYWEDVTLENYALKDLDSFIKKIREVKRKDLIRLLSLNGVKLCDKDIDEALDRLLKVTFVGHSMGGMTFFIYLIDKKLRKQPHGIHEAILLSPGGFHSEKSLFFKTLYSIALKIY